MMPECLIKPWFYDGEIFFAVSLLKMVVHTAPHTLQ